KRPSTPAWTGLWSRVSREEGSRIDSERQPWCCCHWWQPTSTYQSWPREGSATPDPRPPHLSLALQVCRWARRCSPRRIHRYTATSSKRSSAPTKHPPCYSPSTANERCE